MKKTLLVILVLAVLAATGCISDDPDSAGDPSDVDVESLPSAADHDVSLDSPPDDAVEVRVVRVVDGDTLVARYPDGSETRVRVVGIDTPETNVDNQPREYPGVPDTTEGRDCLRGWGENATEYAEDALAGRTVEIAFDPEEPRRDVHSRALTYVYVDNRSYGADAVEHGLARMYREGDFVAQRELHELEQEAQEDGRGLWGCAE